MKYLPTWDGKWGGTQFRYEINGNVDIEYGTGYANSLSIPANDWNVLLGQFKGQKVKLGPSRTAQPANSLGDWLVTNVTKTALASYVGPILVAEGYAKRPDSSSSDIEFI